MNKVIVILLIVLAIAGCTKENFIDTGVADGNHDCSMLEYMRNDPRNWDSTVVLIEHAGLVAMFEGQDPEFPEFTFFGPTKLSVLRYLLDNNIERIADMDPATCKNLVLQYVLKEVVMRDDVTEGTRSLMMPPIPGTGGTSVTTVGGKQCRLFAQTEDYDGVANAGPTHIYLESGMFPWGLKSTDIASADIKFTNGVIHSLHYKHTLGKL